MKQIILPIELDQKATFDSFVEESNAEAVAALKLAIAERAAGQILIYSAQPRGKSHLLQAVCNAAAAAHASSVYLPLRELVGNGAEQLLDGLEQLAVVCLDDVDAIAGNAPWEEALFHCINRMRHQQTVLILAAARPPEQIPLRLADLRSRLSWGPKYPLHGLSDQALTELILSKARQRGLKLGQEIAAYLISRTRRDPAYLTALVAQIDSEAVAAQRKLTIPFVRGVVENFSTGNA